MFKYGYFSGCPFPDLADGAPDNRTFLEPFTSYDVLDFHHVSEYVAEAAEALYPGKKMAGERHAWLKETLHKLKHNEGEAKRLHRKLERASPGNNRIASREKLLKARTYFKNHWHQMIYPEALEKNLPIGSGVTEAACKTLVKKDVPFRDALERARSINVADIKGSCLFNWILG